jgi:hypothetical protein
MTPIINHSIGETVAWSDRGLRFFEVIRQEYSNCVFSGGYVEGHAVDNLYVRLEKDGVVTTELLLRPDEVAALAWIASGLLWSDNIKNVP